MTSRERLLCALDHKEPDKVPLDLNGTIVTSLTRIAYQKLREHLGFDPDPEPEVSHFAMDTVRARQDLIEHYEVDTASAAMRTPFGFQMEFQEDGTVYDEYNLRWKQTSFYYDVVEHPLASAAVEELDNAVWPKEDDPGRYRGLRDDIEALCDRSDACIVADIPGLGPFEGGCFLRGHAEFCTDLYADPAFAEALLDKVTDSMIRFWDNILSEIGDLIDVAAQGDDVGMQTSTYISPEMYRRFVKPRQKRLFEFIRSKTKAKIFYHSCGSVYDFIPDFIEMGVDVLNPVQRSAAKMEIGRLKREFGSDIAFWGGGIDVQQQLPYASTSEIADIVKETMDIMAPGGGFVFFPTHNIQADVSPDRIDAMFEAVRRYRDY